MNKWFFENKKTFKYSVYPKYGTHWNHYGMTIALDSIVKYIEFKRHINLPDFSYDIVNHYNSKLKVTTLTSVYINESFITYTTRCKPVSCIYKFKGGTNYTKPDVLVIGDSYWWCMVGDNLPKQLFKEDEYWFYNKDVVGSK